MKTETVIAYQLKKIDWKPAEAGQHFTKVECVFHTPLKRYRAYVFDIEGMVNQDGLVASCLVYAYKKHGAKLLFDSETTAVHKNKYVNEERTPNKNEEWFMNLYSNKLGSKGKKGRVWSKIFCPFQGGFNPQCWDVDDERIKILLEEDL